jgi:calcium-dependent protein kinase
VHKVADFGFATKADVTGRHLLKECVGTPLYMAPQLLENNSYNAKSDIWSIGMMFYEMLFGKTYKFFKNYNKLLKIHYSL